jgi:teichoic acid transport system ATP-binding protein
MPSDVVKVIRTPDTQNPVAIRLENITKNYRLYKSERMRFLAAFSKRVPHETVTANDNLSFTVRRGEAVALLGANGAGKSTVLKMITGVTYPSSGYLEVNGVVSALLELSAGFDMQLTGLENIRLKAQITGLSHARLEEMLPGIIEFADLGTFINQPMRTYSSGMKSRLGFAFASSIEPDILIIDEALSVGDRRFAQKCIERVKEILTKTHIAVLFVTHATSMAQEFCKRGIVLEKGRAVFDAAIQEAVSYYEEK